MKETYFDEAFEKLLQEGNRHDIANYRNCIIEEQRRRVTKEDVETANRIFKNVLGGQKNLRLKYGLLTLFFIVLFTLNILMIIAASSRGSFSLILLNTFVGFINILNIMLYGSKFIIQALLSPRLKNSVIVITKEKPESLSTFPEIFKVISCDNVETLCHKKARLDEFLGL